MCSNETTMTKNDTTMGVFEQLKSQGWEFRERGGYGHRGYEFILDGRSPRVSEWFEIYASRHMNGTAIREHIEERFPHYPAKIEREAYASQLLETVDFKKKIIEALENNSSELIIKLKWNLLLKSTPSPKLFL